MQILNNKHDKALIKLLIKTKGIFSFVLLPDIFIYDDVAIIFVFWSSGTGSIEKKYFGKFKCTKIKQYANKKLKLRNVYIRKDDSGKMDKAAKMLLFFV